MYPIVIKTAHRRALKTLVSQEIFASIGLIRIFCRIFNLKNVISISRKKLSNIALRIGEAFYNISVYLYNNNVSEYVQIARSGPKSMIRNIEGLSNI